VGTVPTQDFSLPHSSEAPESARRIVEEQLAPLLPKERGYDLVQLVSELVANAVRFSPPRPDGTIGLHLEHSNDAVRVAVTDGGTHLVPDELTFDASSDERFGLFLVDSLADGWGFSLDGVKGVWIEVDLLDA
jgi:anti-sigma regulatory factor (Ser/Thr protein kinase)